MSSDDVGFGWRRGALARPGPVWGCLRRVGDESATGPAPPPRGPGAPGSRRWGSAGRGRGARSGGARRLALWRRSVSAPAAGPPNASTSAREELRGPRRVCAVLTESGVQDRPRPLDLRRPVPPALQEVDLGRRPGVERGILAPGGPSRFDAGAGDFREDPAAAGLPAGGPPGGPHAPRLPPPPGADRRRVVGFTHVPTRHGAPRCTAFVTGPVRAGRIGGRGHQRAHGAPTTRPAPLGRRSRRARTARAATPGGPAPPRWPVPVHRLHRTTRRRGHRGPGRSKAERSPPGAHRGDRLALGQGLPVADGPVLHPAVAVVDPGQSGRRPRACAPRRPFSVRQRPGPCTGSWRSASP